jgi:hypothetical protein
MDTSECAGRPRSSSVENERRLEENWAQTYPNAIPAIETANPTFPWAAYGATKVSYRRANGSLFEGRLSPTKSHQSPLIEKENDSTSGGRTLFDRYNESVQNQGKKSLIGNGLRMEEAKIAKEEHILKEVEEYAEPFVNFMTENPTIWHAIEYWENKLKKAGFAKVRFSCSFSRSLSFQFH